MDKMPLSQSSTAHATDDELPEDLQAIARYYAMQPIPRPSQAQTTALMQRLLVEASSTAQGQQGREHITLWRIFAIARWRVVLLGPWFWITGVLLLLLISGALLVNNRPMMQERMTSPSVNISLLVPFLILLLPLGALFGLAYALRTPSAGLRAIEASCPVSFAQTAIGMALAVLSFDCLLGVLATLGIALAHWAPFWTLLLAWLTPLLLISAISLPLTLLYNARVAILIAGLPWLFLGINAMVQQSAHSVVLWFFSLPQGMPGLSSHLAVVALCLLFLIVLFFSAPRWQRLCTF